MRLSGFFTLSLLIILAYPSLALAGVRLTQREVFARCYAQLTGQRLSPRDPRLSQLASKSAATLCSDLLNSVNFGNDGALIDRNNAEHRRILKQFHDLHRSWFERQFFDQNQFGDGMFGTVDIYEAAQPSFHITRALFGNDPYKNVLRGSQFLKATRDSSGLSTQGSSSNFFRPSRMFVGGFDGDASYNINSHTVISTRVNASQPDNYVLVPTSLVAVGALVGIGVSNEISAVPFMYTDQNGRPNPAGFIGPHNLHSSYGGGALGSQGFLLATFGHSFDYKANGTTKLPRKWVTSALKSFLCRADGYLRDADVPAYMRTGIDAPAFRQATSCLKCHATMDQAALVARNLTPSSTGFLTSTHTRMTASIGAFSAGDAPESGQEFWPSRSVNNFNRQTAEGQFYFRTMDGNLIDQRILSLENFGALLGTTEDYYACAASRYVEYFTGISVPIVDPGTDGASTRLASMSEQELKWREFVIDLGRQLMRDGNLKNMISAIFASEIYQQSDFGK